MAADKQNAATEDKEKAAEDKVTTVACKDSWLVVEVLANRRRKMQMDRDLMVAGHKNWVAADKSFLDKNSVVDRSWEEDKSWDRHCSDSQAKIPLACNRRHQQCSLDDSCGPTKDESCHRRNSSPT